MPDQRAPLALYHILDAINDLLAVLDDLSADELSGDRIRCYAAERCIEILSEASRRIPNEWKNEHPSVPWQSIAGIGNVIRHNYENVSPAIIVALRGGALDVLRTAVLALLDKYDLPGKPFRDR